ncbi:MAG: PEP-CTERM sorting domain-containing protein [Thermogutta sp.]
MAVKNWRRYLGTALLLVVSNAMNNATMGGIIYNGGFEDNFFSSPNWSASEAYSGALQRLTSASKLAAGGTWYPKEGSYFLMIKSAEENKHTILSQEITLRAGETVSGWMAIDAYLNSYDYADNDYVEFCILADSTPVFTKTLTVTDLKGGLVSLDWQYWSWTAPKDGSYKIELRAMDDTSKVGAMAWWGLFDGIAVTSSPVPEPGLLPLLTTGVVGVSVLNRFKRWRDSRRDS